MNRGALATKAEIDRRGISINQAARAVGADSGTFSKILREEQGRKPGRALAQRIFREFGISPTLWDESEAGPANTEQLEQPDHTGTLD